MITIHINDSPFITFSSRWYPVSTSDYYYYNTTVNSITIDITQGHDKRKKVV